MFTKRPILCNFFKRRGNIKLDEVIIIMISTISKILAFYFCMTYISSSLNYMNFMSTAWKVLVWAKCLFLDKRVILSTIKYTNNLF